MTAPSLRPFRLPCPQCGAAVGATDSFCEACGSELTPTQVPPVRKESHRAPFDSGRDSAGSLAERVDTRPCQSCGGVVGEDSYCQTCGTKARSLRDHFNEVPASWVAGVCDRGIRHERNEDAIATAAQAEPGSRAVLVVCDGVSTSEDSDVASLAGARAARDMLVTYSSAGLGGQAGRVGALYAALVAAAKAGNEAVIDHTSPDSDNAASCTFAAAVVEGELIAFGNVGDSRVYWIPDAGEALELSVDDSVAQARIQAGVSRAEAEAGPHAHAITKWLGRDSHDFAPRTGSLTVEAPGWLLVCSDGLWNYASEAGALQALISEQSATVPQTAGIAEPLPLAEALVNWANGQGGKDNISAVLARISPALSV